MEFRDEKGKEFKGDCKGVNVIIVENREPQLHCMIELNSDPNYTYTIQTSVSLITSKINDITTLLEKKRWPGVCKSISIIQIDKRNTIITFFYLTNIHICFFLIRIQQKQLKHDFPGE